MFADFDQSARLAVVEAQEVARSLGHPTIGNEHLLLAILGSNDGVARTFSDQGMTVDGLHEEIVRVLGTGDTRTHGQMGFTEGLKRVLETAHRAQVAENCKVDSTSLAVAVLKDRDGVAQAFDAAGVDIRDLARALDSA